LLRRFLTDTDLAILFNTRRCRYQCKFCNLPAKSTTDFVSVEDVISQFDGVFAEVKHAAGVIDRLTIANGNSSAACRRRVGLWRGQGREFSDLDVGL